MTTLPLPPIIPNESFDGDQPPPKTPRRLSRVQRVLAGLGALALVGGVTTSVLLTQSNREPDDAVVAEVDPAADTPGLPFTGGDDQGAGELDGNLVAPEPPVEVVPAPAELPDGVDPDAEPEVASPSPDASPSVDPSVSPSPSPSPSPWTAAHEASSLVSRYLELTGFSRQGLIAHIVAMHGDVISTQVAVQAVDGQRVDWVAQAGRVAREYLDLNPLSASTVKNILVVQELFTDAEATTAIAGLVVDWNAQAKATGQIYLAQHPFTRAQLLEALTKVEGFTSEQATFAVEALGLK